MPSALTRNVPDRVGPGLRHRRAPGQVVDDVGSLPPAGRPPSARRRAGRARSPAVAADDVVAAALQVRHEVPPDEARRSGDERLHGRPGRGLRRPEPIGRAPDIGAQLIGPCPRPMSPPPGARSAERRPAAGRPCARRTRPSCSGPPAAGRAGPGRTPSPPRPQHQRRGRRPRPAGRRAATRRAASPVTSASTGRSRADDGHAGRHGLERWQAEALVDGGVGQAAGPGQQVGPGLRRRPSRGAGCDRGGGQRPPPRRTPRRPSRRGRPRRAPRSWRRPAARSNARHQGGEILAGLHRAQGQHVAARRPARRRPAPASPPAGGSTPERHGHDPLRPEAPASPAPRRPPPRCRSAPAPPARPPDGPGPGRPACRGWHSSGKRTGVRSWTVTTSAAARGGWDDEVRAPDDVHRPRSTTPRSGGRCAATAARSGRAGIGMWSRQGARAGGYPVQRPPRRGQGRRGRRARWSGPVGRGR